MIATGARQGTRNFRVFGSLARATAGPGSDINLVADFDPGRSLFDQGALVVELSELLEVAVGVASANGVRTSPSPRARRILDEAVPL